MGRPLLLDLLFRCPSASCCHLGKPMSEVWGVQAANTTAWRLHAAAYSTPMRRLRWQVDATRRRPRCHRAGAHVVHAVVCLLLSQHFPSHSRTAPVLLQPSCMCCGLWWGTHTWPLAASACDAHDLACFLAFAQTAALAAACATPADVLRAMRATAECSCLIHRHSQCSYGCTCRSHACHYSCL
jgi:hypothetical protein